MISDHDLRRTDIDVRYYREVKDEMVGNARFAEFEAATSGLRHQRWVMLVYAVPENSDYQIVQVQFTPGRCDAYLVTARSGRRLDYDVTSGVRQFAGCEIPGFLMEPYLAASDARPAATSITTLSHRPLRYLIWGDANTRCASIVRTGIDLRWFNEFRRATMFGE